MTDLRKWEKITQHTERMRVPGGWLYRCIVWGLGEEASPGVAMTFVPDTARAAQLNEGSIA